MGRTNVSLDRVVGGYGVFSPHPFAIAIIDTSCMSALYRLYPSFSNVASSRVPVCCRPFSFWNCLIAW
jgi:hypothetical protein